MAFTNNVMIVRHKLLANLVALWKENQLIEKIDRIPAGTGAGTGSYRLRQQ